MICSEPAQGVAEATAWTPLPGPPTSAPHQKQLAYGLARRHLARPACAGRRTTLRESTFLPTFAQRGFALRASRPPQINPRQGSPPRHLQRTGVSAVSALGRPTANMHYSAGSDSCRRSPPPTGLPVYLALPSDRSAPNHVMPPLDRLVSPAQRRARVSGFATRSQARRNTPPNRVRHPTDRPFASGYSPPRLATTQLPSATELWHTRTRTLTVQTMRPHGRTSAGFQPARRAPGSMPGARRLRRSQYHPTVP